MPASEVKCPVCHGLGTVRGRYGEIDFCDVCQGSGVFVGFVCVNPEQAYIDDRDD